MKLNRREFIGLGAAAAGGFAFAKTYEPFAVPTISKATYRKGGDHIRMAFIGSGGRGGANLHEFYALGEEIVALCDVDMGHADWAANEVKERCPNARKYQDWRVMLDKERDLDAVVVSTPDHMHAACAIAAMERGFHVYVEKPLVRTWWEAERFRDVAEKCGVVTQMGNNGNGTDGQRRDIELFLSGVLGEIREIHVTTDRPIWPQGLERPAGEDPIPANLAWDLWLGVAPARPFKRDVYHSFKWRGWFDFGTGAIGDISCHSMSAFWRGLALRTPVAVETLKSTPKFAETFPAATTVKLTVTRDGQTAPVDIFWYDGNTRPDAETSRRISNGRSDSMGGTTIVGTKGTWHNGSVMMTGETKFTRPRDHEATKNIPATLPRVKNHHWEFAEAIRGGSRPLSYHDHSVPLTEAVLLGSIAQRVEGHLEWDCAEGRFKNSDAANLLLKPHVRDGWTIG